MLHDVLNTIIAIMICFLIGIPSSPVLIDSDTYPGLLILMLRTEFPGDTNITFTVNITDLASQSLVASTSNHFIDYQSNSIINISIALPDGGIVLVSLVTSNQYGISDIFRVSGVFDVQPSE